MATKKFDRSKFKPANVADLKKNIAQDDEELGKGGSAFLAIKPGSNRLRLYPPHPGMKSFYVRRGVHWLTFPASDDSDKTYRGTVPNARVHGGWDKDVVEEYMRMAKVHLEKSKDEDADEKLKKMTDWKDGLSLSTSWIAYAARETKKEDGGWNKEFGELDMNRTVRDGINALSTVEDGDEPITIDPFTDPDDGIPVIVSYDKEKEKAKRYSVVLAKKASPLTDEELERFEKVPTLEEKYGKNSYTKDDYDRACEGLQYFDEENEIGLWETDEWEETLEELSALFEEDKPKTKSKPSTKSSKSKDDEEEEEEETEEEEEEEEEKPKKKSAVKKEEPKKTSKKKPAEEEEEEEEPEEEEEEEEAEEEEGDKFDEMDRSALKAYNAKKSLGVKVTTNMSDDDLRAALRKAEASNEEEEETEEEEEEEEKPKAKDKVSLDAIKANLKAKMSKK